ncbi:MAG: serine protease [Lysobacter sp.]|nr:serine protease [Lysobacter sp.]
MNKSLLTLSIAIGVALFGIANAAEIVPVYADGANEGYYDTTAVAPVGGNPATTRGAQRRIVAQFAADLWGQVLVSDVPVFIGAQFNPLGANVLGSAGATFIFRDEPEFPFQDTWYSSALADALTGRDLNPGFTDIGSQFSSEFNFYYGLDGNTPAGQISFLDTVMHEFGHGLGFQNFVDEASGAFQSNTADIYSRFTFDNSTGQFWTQMNKPGRKASAINYGNVVFTGSSARAGAALVLDDRQSFRVTAPAAIAGNYPYGTASFGPPVSPSNFGGNVVNAVDAANAAGPSTTDGCTAYTNAGAVAGRIALVDRGGCGFVVKAAVAQAAGATGLIVANNVAGSPPPGMGGTDPAVTIPAISVTQPDGALLRQATGVTVAFVVDTTKLQGADDLGRPRLYTPNPVQPGSTGSHYDTDLAPNALMEPAINDSLNAALNIDITPNLLQDTGWRLNPGNAVINGCNTTIDIVDDAGLIIGANVVATNNLVASTSANKGAYKNAMRAYRDRLQNAGLITSGQASALTTCINAG